MCEERRALVFFVLQNNDSYVIICFTKTGYGSFERFNFILGKFCQLKSKNIPYKK